MTVALRMRGVEQISLPFTALVSAFGAVGTVDADITTWGGGAKTSISAAAVGGTTTATIRLRKAGANTGLSAGF